MDDSTVYECDASQHFDMGNESDQTSQDDMRCDQPIGTDGVAYSSQDMARIGLHGMQKS